MNNYWNIEIDVKTDSRKFWMITGDGNQPKVRQPSREKAIKEAERLARIKPGTKFYVLEAVEVIEQPSGLSYTKL